MSERTTAAATPASRQSRTQRKSQMSGMGQTYPYCGNFGRPVLASNKTFAHTHHEWREVAECGHSHWLAYMRRSAPA